MSFHGPNPPAETDSRRKRLRYQAWHRGTREMDLILGRFTDQHIASLTEPELVEMEHLLAVPDTTLYRWISDQEPAPGEFDGGLLKRIKAWLPGTLKT